MADSNTADTFTTLTGALKEFECRTSVTRSGEAVLTFVCERKYAILTADLDGDLALTLTDRASTDETDAEVVSRDVGALTARIRGFLEQ